MAACRSVGYRFGNLAYSSDVVDLPEPAFEALEGLDVWIVDALRYTPHPTHAHVDQALAWIDRVQPEAGDPDQSAHRSRLRGARQPAAGRGRAGL